MTWILWTVLFCAAFIVGFFVGAVVSADAALGDAKRRDDDEGWPD